MDYIILDVYQKDLKNINLIKFIQPFVDYLET